MSLFRRGKWWWTDFSVNGVRYRQPIRDENGFRTRDWREALSREKDLISVGQGGQAGRVESAVRAACLLGSGRPLPCGATSTHSA